MVLKHAAARKCRFLPLEVISRMDFSSRFPEINLDDSQSNIKISDTGLPGSSDVDSLARFCLGDDEADENDNDLDDDVGPGQLVLTSSLEAQSVQDSTMITYLFVTMKKLKHLKMKLTMPILLAGAIPSYRSPTRPPLRAKRGLM
jgi:hypothetical protein